MKSPKLPCLHTYAVVIKGCHNNDSEVLSAIPVSPGSPELLPFTLLLYTWRFRALTLEPLCQLCFLPHSEPSFRGTEGRISLLPRLALKPWAEATFCQVAGTAGAGLHFPCDSVAYS